MIEPEPPPNDARSAHDDRPGTTLPRRSVIAVAAVVTAVGGLAFALPPSGSGASDATQFFGRFHTLAVHLPVGALVLVTITEGLALFRRMRARADAALDFAVPFLLASAALAIGLGVLLAHGTGYPTKLVALHRGLTLAGLVGCAASTIAWTQVRVGGSRAWFRGALAMTAALLSGGAHFGGSLTHGDDYLFRYAPAPLRNALGGSKPEKPTTPATPSGSGAQKALVYADLIAPILEKRCVGCHGPDKAKGRLRLDTIEGLRAGGEHGPALEPKNGRASSIVQRMRLPVGDDERMPPSDREAPSTEEIELVAWWIDRGADPALPVADVLVPEGPRRLLEKAAGEQVHTNATATATTAPTTAAPATAAPAVTSPRPTTPTGEAPPRTPTTPTTTTTPTTIAGQQPVFAARVAPLLDAKCGTCHAHGKAKGQLRVDSIDALLRGGAEGPAVVRGEPTKGSLLARIEKAPEDREHMPPRTLPQLTASEKGLLSWWVRQGAPERVAAIPGAFARATSATSATASSHTDPGRPSMTSEPTALPPTWRQLRGPELFTKVVAPVLQRRCGECHYGADASSGTRFDEAPRLLADGFVVAGKPAESPLAARMLLASSRADHMPPKDSPQPTADEIAAIQAWISDGARIEAAAPTAAASTSVGSAEPTPAPAEERLKVPPSAGGCGACASVVSTTSASTSAVMITSLLLLALGSRRRTRSARRVPTER